MKSGVISAVKTRIVTNVSRPRKVPFGVYRGLRLNINLRSQSQVFFGLWERETYAAIRQSANSVQWCIDVGAGKGEMAIYFARHPHVRTVKAVEPDINEAALIRDNARLNGVVRIDVLEKMIGTSEDRGYIGLDDIRVDRSACGFVKIDVDGGEVDVLESGVELLKSGDRTLLIETHSLSLEQECIRFLDRFDYSSSIIRNAWWRALLPEQRPISHNRWIFSSRAS